MDVPRKAPTSVLLRDRYRPLELIARGGMGSIFRARDEFLQRDVAVKIFPGTSPALIEVGKQELTVLANLQHHGLVTLLDAGVDRSTPDQPHIFLVMELIKTHDLANILAGRKESALFAGYIGFDIAEALEYVHARGIVHRDIKPANILVLDHEAGQFRPRAKLTDFGIAAFEGAQSLRTDGQTVGTAAYLSPEQASGLPLTTASDIYSLGLVVIEAITGQRVYTGELKEAIAARLHRDPEIPAQLSPAWRDLLTGMVARDPANRPSAGEVMKTFRDILIEEIGKNRSLTSVFGSEDQKEEARIEAVKKFEILDTPPEGAFDRITDLAARLLTVPVALVSIVDTDRIWFKSRHGTEITEIPRDAGLCSRTVRGDAPLVLSSSDDVQTLVDPSIASEFGLKFYAGVPLTTDDGHNLGTLCVLDFEPREISDSEIATLKDLAALVMSHIELRLQARKLVAELDSPVPA